MRHEEKAESRGNAGVSQIEVSANLAPRSASVPALIDFLGPERIAFDTGMPLMAAQPAPVKLHLLEAEQEVKERVGWGDAARMLGL